MESKQISLTQLSRNRRAKIIGLTGGYGFQRKLRVMGIREGQIVQILTKQPFRGPLTISVGKGNVTLGRGMANKIIVEEI